MNLNHNHGHVTPHPVHLEAPSVNAKTGRAEVPFANLHLIYPRLDAEYSFEELRAQHRGLLNIDWNATRKLEQEQANIAMLAARKEITIPKRLTPKFQKQAEDRKQMLTHTKSETIIEPIPSPLADEDKSPSVNLEIDADAVPASLRGDEQTQTDDQPPEPNIEFMIHIDDEQPASTLEGPRAAEKLLVHIDNDDPTSVSDEDQAIKASTKLLVHVDGSGTTSGPKDDRKTAPSTNLVDHVENDAPPQSTSPAQTGKKKATKAFAVLADDEPEPHTKPLVEPESRKEPLKTQTVPLKGFDDEPNLNDENMPPSQLDFEKAKATKKARREERSNRTRKIKVMEVKEIRNETQTSK